MQKLEELLPWAYSLTMGLLDSLLWNSNGQGHCFQNTSYFSFDWPRVQSLLLSNTIFNEGGKKNNTKTQQKLSDFSNSEGNFNFSRQRIFQEIAKPWLRNSTGDCQMYASALSISWFLFLIEWLLVRTNSVFTQRHQIFFFVAMYNLICVKNIFFIGMCTFSWQSLVRIQKITLLEEHSNILLMWELSGPDSESCPH